MKMTPRIQKLALLAHVTLSVGWIGAVLPYLALAVAGFASPDVLSARASFLSMELIGWYVIVPLSFAALLSGLVQSLGTQWGLFRHWWILAKLGLTLFAVVILFQHMQEVSRIANTVKAGALSGIDFRPELIHAGGGLLVLLATATLSIFKPWGRTAYGQHRVLQTDSPSRSGGDSAPVSERAFAPGRRRWTRIIGIHAGHAVAIVLLLAVILHVTGMHHH
jgi:hypothetical protein